MEKINPNKKVSDSPFFNALEQAEAIQVREISPQNGRGIITSLESALREFDSDAPAVPYRSFLVQLRVPAPATPEPAPEVPPTDSSLSADALNQSAELLLAAGDYLLAKSIFGFVLKNEPKQLAAHKGMGICFLRLGDSTSARKCFRSLMDTPLHAEGLLWLSQCYFVEKNEDLALGTLLEIAGPEALAGKEERFQYHKEIGNALTRRGEFASAEANYQRALSLEPTSDTIYVNLGTLETQRGDWEKALQYFEEAKRLNPRNSKSYCGVGLVFTHRQELAKARASYQTALDLDSLNQVALLQLLAISHKNGDYSGVKTRLCRFLLKEPTNAEVRYAFATLLFKDGDWLECDREIDLILAASPTHAKAAKLKQDLAAIRHRA